MTCHHRWSKSGTMLFHLLCTIYHIIVARKLGGAGGLKALGARHVKEGRSTYCIWHAG